MEPIGKHAVVLGASMAGLAYAMRELPLYLAIAPRERDERAESDDPQGGPARLRSMMKERHDESVKILTGWIDNKENAL